MISLLYGPTLTSIHDYWKTIALTRRTFVSKVLSLFFKKLSRFVITFLSRSKPLLISWLQSLSMVILEPKKIKFLTVSTVCPSICHEVMGPDIVIFVFWILSFKPGFSLSSFTFIKRLYSSSYFLLLGWKVKSLSHFRLSATPWTVAYHAPPSMGFSRQEYWNGLPFPSPGDLPDPRIESGSPALQADSLPRDMREAHVDHNKRGNS